MGAQKIAQIPKYDWNKLLANEKWARLAITGISRNRYFLLKLYSNPIFSPRSYAPTGT